MLTTRNWLWDGALRAMTCSDPDGWKPTSYQVASIVDVCVVPCLQHKTNNYTNATYRDHTITNKNKQ